MTVRLMLGCVLTVVILVMSGCGLFGNTEPPSSPTNTNSSSPSPTTQSQTRINFAEVETQVRDASNKLMKQQPGRPSESVTVRQVKGSIKAAITKLGGEQDKVDELCTDCPEQAKNVAKDVLTQLAEVQNDLGKDSQKIADVDENLKTQIQRRLDQIADQLHEVVALTTAALTPNSTPTSTPAKTKIDIDESDWWGTALLAGEVLAIVLVLVLVAAALTYLWRRSWQTVEANIGNVVNRHVTAVRDAQPDFTDKLSSLSSSQREMSTRLTELDTEVRSLARLVRESLANRNDRHPPLIPVSYQSQYEDSSPKDEPEFPVSALDYLGKMDRFANVVRPDFQNGILVHDPDGKGEFVLIRDSRFPDETRPLFVVPRATQFQTKQDFYTYYQKYYDCDRPSAGDVWIIGPAVVEKVSGGWQLREKGMLEVR